MKMSFRIALHFVLSLLLMLFLLGLSMMFIEEIVPESNKNFNQAPLFGIIVFVVFAISYGWYLGRPLRHLISWIRQLAEGNYSVPDKIQRSYQPHNHQMKKPYQLYQDVLLNVWTLTNTLQENELKKQQLDELKKEWIAGISHDLKTPLTYINGYSTMLLSPHYQWTEEEKEQFLKEIHAKSIHLQELIQDLNLSLQLDENKIPLNLKKVDIIEFVRRVVADAANDPRAKDDQIEFYTYHERAETEIDEKLFKRALQNLMMNAIIHNPPGTTIQVSIRVSSQVQIVIQDNGKGMDKETVDNLFVKYYRGTPTDTPAEGTGLGMSIVKQLISVHKGTIDVHSQLNKGTTVTISLPRQLASA
ncbi:sensor histidine kinase [Laceyella tengchongensis]